MAKVVEPELRRGKRASFTEAGAWNAVGTGWNHLFGSFDKVGVSFEWHDFSTDRNLDWGKSFHPESVEICLNLTGNGSISVGKARAEFAPHSAGFYHQGTTPLSARRSPGERHQFLTVEYSVPFIRACFSEKTERLHPLVIRALEKTDNSSGVSETQTLT